MLKKIKQYLITILIIQFVIGSVHPATFNAVTIEATDTNPVAELSSKGQTNESTTVSEPLTTNQPLTTITATEQVTATEEVTPPPPAVSVTSVDVAGDDVTFAGNIDNITSGIIRVVFLDADLLDSPILSIVGTETWAYTFKDLSEGVYNYKVQLLVGGKVMDTTEVQTFTVDVTKPKVSSIELEYLNKDNVSQKINLLKKESPNRISREITLAAYITDNFPMNPEKLTNVLKISSSEGVDVTSAVPRIEKVDNDGKKYKVIFKPDTLKASTTYNIYINPSYVDGSSAENWATDAVGNPVNSIIKKFTTEKFVDEASLTEQQKEYHSMKDPHGNYMSNTNTCKVCHSSHDASGPKLEQANFKYETQYYCMSCHDGTLASKADGLHFQDNKHFSRTQEVYTTEVNADGTETVQVVEKGVAGDCASCHNPHSGWSEENPNLLKENHYEHTHSDTNKQTIENYPYNQTIDSNFTPCNSCHMDDNIDLSGSIKPLNYRSSTGTGVADDYTLCFRCHDGTKKWTDNGEEKMISDISKYYKNKDSSHRISAIDSDGDQTKLTATGENDGHIPCAVCHATHGSTNKKMIKTKIGHGDRKAYSTPTSGEWTTNAEMKEFCITCHNGSTSIYGVTGRTFSDITPHQESSPMKCTQCHGGASETFVEAVHSPSGIK